MREKIKKKVEEEMELKQKKELKRQREKASQQYENSNPPCYGDGEMI